MDITSKYDGGAGKDTFYLPKRFGKQMRFVMFGGVDQVSTIRPRSTFELVYGKIKVYDGAARSPFHLR